MKLFMSKVTFYFMSNIYPIWQKNLAISFIKGICHEAFPTTFLT